MNEPSEFKEYPRTYEYVFDDKEKNAVKLKMDKVSCRHNNPASVDLYLRLFKEETDKYLRQNFDSVVKLIWLNRRFEYFTHARGTTSSIAKGIFFRTVLNNDFQFVRKFLITELVTNYLNDLFPNFDIHSPYEYEYVFPFQYMTISCLSFVKSLPMRMQLLKIGEERKMNLAEFMDYTINYTKCYNDEHGTEYEFCSSTNYPNYIRNYELKTGRVRRGLGRRKIKARSKHVHPEHNPQGAV